MQAQHAAIGQQHPDCEFLYRVGTTGDGRPVWTSRFFIPTSIENPDKENERCLSDRTRASGDMLGIQSR